MKRVMGLKTVGRAFVALVLSVASLTYISISPVRAAGNTCTWTGAGGEADSTTAGKFSTAANWAGCSGAPSNSDNVVIDVSTLDCTKSATIQNDISGLSVGTLTFTGQNANCTPSPTIAGNDITVSSGIINTEKSATYTPGISLSTPLTLGGDASITGDCGGDSTTSLTLSDINLNDHTLTENTTSGCVNIGGTVSGSGNITVEKGVWFLNLSGAAVSNTWTGTLAIAAGAVANVIPGSLGSNDTNVAVSEGGSLVFADFDGSTVTQDITVGGSGTDGFGALDATSFNMKGGSPTSANVTLTGTITLTSNTQVGSSGQMVINGPVVGGYSLNLLPGQSGAIVVAPTTPLQSGLFGGKWPENNLTWAYGSYGGVHRYLGNVYQGAANWNNIGSKIHFSQWTGSPSTPAIQVTDVNFQDDWWGWTLFANSCNSCTYIQNTILLNQRTLDPYSDFIRTKVATHEIGHALGLRHPNDAGWTDKNALPSVMWQGVLHYNKPQEYDITRIGELYP